ncbi:glycerophosphoryl diester phosphodiesterase [Halobiforma haloterrestris]|uniref:Glycerophosphoryl diester phosphodiesterase n=1 Tax=Natronobacterium haloterrestre TaxID=148448 RepID=A0A1I1E5Z4_NATHA|nr:glycerophosphodiester phosphodiesterase family protein [Halobiforma haloterrestris]SFB82504.1 glycerophosphoryl diester phosphodiesterase [Halobiforma haloterrestris]
MHASAPELVAHRGYAGVAPENTRRAVREAAASDATMIEIDVQPAACGTPVVVHDERLEGTRERDGRPLTDAEGLVRETALEEIRSARVLGTDETVPTLAEVLEAVPETVGLNVELKNPGAADLRVGESLAPDERDERRAVWEPFVERVVDVCDGFGGELLFSSFCEGALAALRAVDSRYAAGVLVWDDLEAGFEVADRYDCEAIHPPRNAVAGTALATTSYAGFPSDEPEIDVLERAHDAGRAVNVWTVETWHQYDQLAAAGVDGIVAEYPGLSSR